MTPEQIKKYNDIIETFPETCDDKNELLYSIRSLLDELTIIPNRDSNLQIKIDMLNLFILMIESDLSSQSKSQQQE